MRPKRRVAQAHCGIVGIQTLKVVAHLQIAGWREAIYA
jgi:hypothetical protein